MSDVNHPPVNPVNNPNQFAKDFFTRVQTSIVDAASVLAQWNGVLLKGQIGYETDTLSFKIGDGTTAYNTLTYVYCGLPVAGEPSLGTPKWMTTPFVCITNYDPASTPTTLNVSLAGAGGVPPGTKAAFIDIYCQSTATGVYFQVRKTGASIGIGQDIQVVNQNIHVNTLIILDANRTFDVFFSGSQINGCYGEIFYYFS